jgi:hypothetical protein
MWKRPQLTLKFGELKEILHLDPTTNSARYDRAIVLANQDATVALSEFEELLKNDPGYVVGEMRTMLDKLEGSALFAAGTRLLSYPMGNGP